MGSVPFDLFGKGCANGDSWKHFHPWSVQGEKLDKVNESYICWNHKGVLHQCHCERRPHQLLGVTKGIHYYKGFHSRVLRISSTFSTNLCTIWWQIELSWAYGGAPWWLSQEEVNEHHPFQCGDKDISLCHDSQPLPGDELDNTIWTNIAIFLYDLFTHKEIDICDHIYHLLTKSIPKRNLRTILSFLSLIMGLIAKTKLKIPSGLTIVQRDYPIGAHTMTWSKAHIIGSRTDISQILRDDVEEEGGDTEDEIDRFT